MGPVLPPSRARAASASRPSPIRAAMHSRCGVLAFSASVRALHARQNLPIASTYGWLNFS